MFSFVGRLVEVLSHDCYRIDAENVGPIIISIPDHVKQPYTKQLIDKERLGFLGTIKIGNNKVVFLVDQIDMVSKEVK